MTISPRSKATPYTVIHRGRASILPRIVPGVPLISTFVTVSWVWTDQNNGEISWTFVNSDKNNNHAVVLYRNNYIFGGAFWPIYLGPDDSISHMLDGAQPIPTLSGNGGQPMGLVDYGVGATPRYLVHFIFNLAPGQTWSTPEGGFIGGTTPTAGACYELTGSTAGYYCVGYDPQRVTDWDNQTGTGNRGYSPDPSTFLTYAFQPEPATPENTLGFTDAIRNGACTIVATAPGACLSAYEQATQPLSPSFFVGGADGHLWQNTWNQASGWLWTDHGTPPGTTITGRPGALFNSPDAGLKFMTLTANGHIFERYWNRTTSSWGWTDHGTPPGTTVHTTPECALDSVATGIKYFMGCADGHLWENYWNQATEQWLWTDHGTPGS